MQIHQSTLADLDRIFARYDDAIALQHAVSHLHWLPFDREMVQREIAERRQWKFVADNGEVACVFATAWSDPAIWGENNDAAIYIHRIAVNPAFRGQRFVTQIVNWCKQHTHDKKLDFIRLDTWADNLKLREIYEQNGFSFVGTVIPDPSGLPAHYQGIQLNLFEIVL